jgi:hypothetical protein
VNWGRTINDLRQSAAVCSPWQKAPGSPQGSLVERRERLAMPSDPIPLGNGRAARRRSNQLHLAAPAADRKTRAGLIEQSTRPHGNPMQPTSTRPAGPIPAGITQGEEI